MANLNRKARINSQAFALLDPSGQIGLKRVVQQQLSMYIAAPADNDIILRTKFPYDAKLVAIYANAIDDPETTGVTLTLTIDAVATSQATMTVLAADGLVGQWEDGDGGISAVLIEAGEAVGILVASAGGTPAAKVSLTFVFQPQ